MKGLLFTYALTYGGAVVSLFSPWYGLLVYVCFAIIRPDWLWFWAVPPGNYSRIVAIGLLAGWFFRGFGDWRFGRATPSVACIAAFMFWTAASAAGAVGDSEAAWRFVEDLSKIVLPFVVAMTLIESVAQLKQLAWVIVLSTGYVAFELNLSYYQGYNRAREEGLGPLDNNGAALMMVTAASVALFLALGESRWWRRFLALAAAGLMVNCAMFCFSRGGILALIVTAVVGFLVVPKRGVHYLLFLLAVLAGFRLAGPEVVDRFMTVFAEKEERDASASSRMELAANCLELMKEHPLFGIGPMQFPFVSHRFGWPEGKQAHTMWLQVGAEQGVPGLGLLLGFYGATIIGLWRFRRQLLERDPWLLDVARMVTASLAGFGVAAHFLSVQTVELPYYIALLGAGALKCATSTGGARLETTTRGGNSTVFLHSIAAPL
ncbi:MAG TPA: O-antigen ligase family protein [Pirellulales bacterium]|nr:O-antigen ligase family protein [Pirellulales bacterium]